MLHLCLPAAPLAALPGLWPATSGVSRALLPHSQQVCQGYCAHSARTGAQIRTAGAQSLPPEPKIVVSRNRASEETRHKSEQHHPQGPINEILLSPCSSCTRRSCMPAKTLWAVPESRDHIVSHMLRSKSSVRMIFSTDFFNVPFSQKCPLHRPSTSETRCFGLVHCHPQVQCL